MANKKNYNKISTEAAEKAEPVEIETVPEIEPEAPVEIEPLPYFFLGTVANCKKLNVRKAPKANAEVSRIINAGTEVEILEEAGDFYKIGDGEYCMKKFIAVK